jgi:hypothetical protein
MASKNILQDNEIEDLLFLTPPEGSEDELEDFNIDELVCENYDTDTYDHNDDNVDIIDLPDLDQNIFIPNNAIELADPILIVVPNSESLNLKQPLVNSTKTSEVSVVHTPTVDKINTTKRTKFREIKSVVWKKRPFQISPDEIKFKGDTSLPQDPFFDLESPLDFFNYFFSSNLLQHICEESLRYSLQKNVNKPFEITETDLKRYLGICIMTSICIVPDIRQYWSENLENNVIKNTMTVNKFEKIRQFLHFCNNDIYIPRGQPGHDRSFRIRTVLETLKKRFQTVPLEESLSVDEQLCATKGRHYMKQYMPMKPHKWGYKLFILAGVSGFAYNIEIYSGQENDPQYRLTNEPDLGASANIVVRLCRIIPTYKNYVVYFDNYYTSLGLLVYLKNIGVLSLGTVRRNRLKQVKLPNEKEFMKSERGSSAECIKKIQNNILSAVVWKDNRLVTLLSTFVGEQPKSEVLRFSKSQKKSVNVPCPSAVTIYNKHMGGVDLLDANIGRYKIRMRSRKWYIRLFYHLLDTCVVNAWILQKRVLTQKNEDDKIITLVKFREVLAVTLCQTSKNINITPTRGRPCKKANNVYMTDRKKPRVVHTSTITNRERYDCVSHWPVWNTTRQRCKYTNCKGFTYVNCSKCKTFMCFNKNNSCFVSYHTN